MATHSSILAWKIPRTESPGRLESVLKVAKSQTQLSTWHTQTQTHMFTYTYIHTYIHFYILFHYGLSQGI